MDFDRVPRRNGRWAATVDSHSRDLGPSARSTVEAVVSQPGTAVDPQVQAALDARFDTDFSHVRIHSDDEAARSSRSLHADAYTVGHHVVFGSGNYQPHSQAGLRLLAHELAHVPQQPSAIAPRVRAVSASGSEPELHAEAAGASLGRVGPRPVHENGIVYRAPSGSLGDPGVAISPAKTDSVVRTDNFRELLRQTIEEKRQVSVTEDALNREASKYLSSAPRIANLLADPVASAFAARVSLFGRVTTTLKNFKPPGWEASGGNEAACFVLAASGAAMTAGAGEDATGGGGVLLYEKVAQQITTDKAAGGLAAEQIKRHVDSGRALVAGVSEPAHNSVVDAKKQPVTDHFVAIYGYETDAAGTMIGVLAKDNAVSGTAEVRFVVAADGSITKPAETRPKGEEYLNQEYQLSEVRFSSELPYTGPSEPKNDAGAIMYWPVPKKGKP